MKEFHLLVWLTQLGLGVAVPMAGFAYLGIWLQQRFAIGVWIVFLCIALGLLCAISNLRASIRAMERMSKSKKEEASAPVSFNKHQ